MSDSDPRIQDSELNPHDLDDQIPESDPQLLDFDPEMSDSDLQMLFLIPKWRIRIPKCWGSGSPNVEF